MRLIDADELLKAIANSGLIWETNECLDVIETLAVKKIVDDAPTVEERPKGKWLKSSNMSKRSYQRLCSNCKHIVYFCGDGNYPNCPYCLADMKGEENG